MTRKFGSSKLRYEERLQVSARQSGTGHMCQYGGLIRYENYCGKTVIALSSKRKGDMDIIMGKINLAAPQRVKRGRKIGEQRKLTSEQDEEIMDLLIDHLPEQLGLSDASWLWTNKTIRLLIEQQLGKVIPLRTISDYRKRWGFLPRKPTYRTSRQDQELFSNWEEKEYREIVGRIKKEKAEIHWFDCAEIKGDVTMISTIDNRGKFRFMLRREPVTPNDYARFFYRLAKDCKLNIFLLFYDHKMMHYKDVISDTYRKGIEMQYIESCYIPSTLPEHNPEEDEDFNYYRYSFHGDLS